MKKAVFFDIDGTLWDGMGIPDSTQEAVVQLREHGICTFLCSGRALACIRNPSLLALSMDGIIAGCGTYVSFRGQELRHKTIPPKEILQALTILKAYDLPVALEGRDHYYMEPEEIAESPFLQGLQNEVGELVRGIAESHMKWEVNKFAAFVKNPDYPKAVEALQDLFDIQVHNGIMVEGVPKGFNKVSGMQLICETLGIPREDTYAFGDSINDVGMLQYAAHGIAMGSGMQEAKDAADYITTGICEDGIYHACRHFGLI